MKVLRPQIIVRSQKYFLMSSSDQYGHTACSSNDQNQQQRPYFECIGLLKANWHNRHGKIRAVNYGTAFLITPRILLTCAHNIYAQELLSQASQIEFAANVSEGSMDYIYSSTKKLIIKRQSTHETYKIKPIKQELCLILLQKPIQKCVCQLKLKSLSKTYNKSKEETRLKIVGYPSKNFASLPSLKDINIKRQELQGQLSSIQDFTIHHTCQTQPGISGSPILSFTQNGQPFVIGIHTHRGSRGINSGLFFSDQILDRIQKYVDEINQDYNLTQKILFINDSIEKVESEDETWDSDYENQSDIEFE